MLWVDTLYEKVRYAEFSDKARGACLLLPIAGRPYEFAGFPYPRSLPWFEEERDALMKIFICHGESRSTRPSVTLQRYALLTQITTDPNQAPHYIVKQPGELFLAD